MRRFGFRPRLTVVLALAVLNGGCILIPDIEDRVVELAVGGSATVQFVSAGTVNTFNETNTVNVRSGFDLGQVLADAGIDVSRVSKIALSGVEYRVTVPDPDPAREIVDGTITITRGASGELPLISSFNAAAGAATGWQVAPLDLGGAGVAEINAMLGEIKDALPGSPPASATTLTYHVTGQSLPALSPTHFTWELKIKITITGTVDVKVLT